MWFELASHLNMPLQLCQQQTSSIEFRDWMYYLRYDINGFHREDFYFAQISSQIANIFAKNPEKRLEKLDKLTKNEAPNQEQLNRFGQVLETIRAKI